MAKRWLCCSGHSGEGPVAGQSCPFCGLPVFPAPADRPAPASEAPAAGEEFGEEDPDEETAEPPSDDPFTAAMPGVSAPWLPRLPDHPPRPLTATAAAPPAPAVVPTASERQGERARNASEQQRVTSTAPSGAADEPAGAWVRRRPVAAALVLAAVLTPSVLAAWMASDRAKLRAERQELERQKAEGDRAQERLTAAVADLRKSNAVVGDLRRRLAEAEDSAQKEFPAAARAAEDLLRLAPGEPSKPEVEPVRQALLRQAVLACRRFTAHTTADEPAGLYRAARAHHLLADLHAALGEREAALEQQEQAVELFQDLAARGKSAWPPGADCERELLAAYARLFGLLEGADPTESEVVLGRLLARSDAGLPDRPDYRRLRALLLGRRGVCSWRRGRPLSALGDLDRCVDLLDGRDDLPADAARERAAFLNCRAEVRLACLPWWLLGDRDRLLEGACRDAGRAAAALTRQLKTSDDPALAAQVGRAYDSMTTAHNLRHEPLEAQAACEKAAALFRGLHERSPGLAEYRRQYALARCRLGSQLILGGEVASGRREFEAGRQALHELAEKSPGEPGHQLDLARQWLAEGTAEARVGHLARAVAALEACREAARPALERSAEEAKALLLSSCRQLIDCQRRLAAQAVDGAARRRHLGQVAQLCREYERDQPDLRALPWGWEKAAALLERFRVRCLRADASPGGD